MIAGALIAFREFLEAFLIVGVFLGISKKLNLKREKEIILAASVGILFSFILSIITYFFGDSARHILTEERADMLESYLLIFSGIFIAYVMLSLHTTINKGRGKVLLSAHSKLKANTFDLSLFLTIVFLVIREGFEIALFTASSSLFSNFIQNVMGLAIGFSASALISALTFFAVIRGSVGKIMRSTQYILLLVGASLVQNGITLLFETHFGIHLSQLSPIPLIFLPDGETVLGHFLKTLIGIDSEFSLAKLFVMLIYLFVISLLFQKVKTRFR